MGMHAGEYFANIYNLEGLILRNEWLVSDCIMAGLRFILQDLQALVWIPKYEGMTLGQRYVLPNDEINLIRKRRFLVIPVFGEDHWMLGVYDQSAHLARFWDSLQDYKGRQRGKKWARGLEQFLVQCGIEAPSRPVELEFALFTSQRGNWECGLFVLENARVFFREFKEGDQSKTIDWAESALYGDKSNPYNIAKGEDPQNAMIEFWISSLRLELGCVDALRTPDAPTVEWDDRLRDLTISNTDAPEHLGKPPLPQDTPMKSVEDPDDQPLPPVTWARGRASIYTPSVSAWDSTPTSYGPPSQPRSPLPYSGQTDQAKPDRSMSFRPSVGGTPQRAFGESHSRPSQHPSALPALRQSDQVKPDRSMSFRPSIGGTPQRAFGESHSRPSQHPSALPALRQSDQAKPDRSMSFRPSIGRTPQREIRESPMVIDTPIPSPGLGSFAAISLRGSLAPGTPYPPSYQGSTPFTVDPTPCPQPRTRPGSNSGRTLRKEDPQPSSPDQLPTSRMPSLARSSSITPTPKTYSEMMAFEKKEEEKKIREHQEALQALRESSIDSQLSKDLGNTSLKSRSPLPAPPTPQLRSPPPAPPTSQSRSSPSSPPTPRPRSARRRSQATRSYPHETSPHRHLSPTHQPGWAGWEALERQARLAAEAAAEELRGRDRVSRYNRRQESRD